MRVAVITSSDSGYAKQREDISGLTIVKIVRDHGDQVVYQNLLPDDADKLMEELKSICDQGRADLILTTGGTGFSERDCMPEVTETVCDRMAPGIAEAMRSYSMTITKRAMLSRATAGIRNKTLIVNLPGSPKAVRECLDAVYDTLPHGVAILTGADKNCGEEGHRHGHHPDHSHSRESSQPVKGFNHFDNQGNAVMVDVTDKPVTGRCAIARGKIKVSKEVMEAVLVGNSKKGDVLGVARIAGIEAVKRTSDLIPLCHPLMIGKCSVDFEVHEEEREIVSICTVRLDGKTGVEMEALTGVSVSLLTIYDMCKAIDKGMVLSDIHLVKKTGGKSGDVYLDNYGNGQSF